MPIELAIWRIDEGLARLEMGSLDLEERLENLLDEDITIASPNWMVVGRQVLTTFGKRIDLLCIDLDGNLVVVELKKDETPRQVVAQLLDYGSWVKELEDDDIAGIFEEYLNRYHPDMKDRSLDDLFCERFNTRQMPETLNESHELVVVASALDDSTERIVSYLSDEFGVPVNAIFFRVFRDGNREYMTRAWFIDPTIAVTAVEDRRGHGPWNEEFYVSFGHDEEYRNWEDAVQYGFISGGGGIWYSRTLHQLEKGNRVWVNIPQTGYVGVGIVAEPVVRIDKFTVKQDGGSEILLQKMPLKGPQIFEDSNSEELAEYLVRINWVKTVPVDEAIKEKGFFGNQNTVCKPTDKKWVHTVDRLKKRFAVE